MTEESRVDTAENVRESNSNAFQYPPKSLKIKSNRQWIKAISLPPKGKKKQQKYTLRAALYVRRQLSSSQGR